MEEIKKYPSLPSNYVSILDLKQRWLKQKQQQQDEEDEAKRKQQQEQKNRIDNQQQQQQRQVVENSNTNGGDREKNHHRHRQVYDRRAAKDVGKQLAEAVTDSIGFLQVKSHRRDVHDRRRDVVAEKDLGKRQVLVEEKHSGDEEKKKMRDKAVTDSIDSLHVKKKSPPRKVYDRRRRDIEPEKCDGEEDEALIGKSEVRNGDKRWIEKKHVVEMNNEHANRRARSHRSYVTSREKPDNVAVVAAEADGETESGAENVVKKIQKSHSYQMKKKMIGHNSSAPESMEAAPLASVEGQIEDETHPVQALMKKKKRMKNPYRAKNKREKKGLIGDIQPVVATMPEKKKNDSTSESNINLLMNMSRKIREPQIEQKFVHLTVNDNKNGGTGNEANSRPNKNGVVYGHVHSSTRFSQLTSGKGSLVWVKKD